ISHLVDAVGAQEAVIPLLSAADLFLLPSAQESFGLAALEAMACGVPVVASDVGGLPEVIEHGLTGFLHTPGDLDGMASSALRLLEDDALHQQVARASRQRVLEFFCVNRVVPMYERFYERVGGGGVAS
ncbi:MAG: glycosyltransferase, partial [Vicinamibacterales bacterium]